jgi:hypothetical protein
MTIKDVLPETEFFGLEWAHQMRMEEKMRGLAVFNGRRDVRSYGEVVEEGSQEIQYL